MLKISNQLFKYMIHDNINLKESIAFEIINNLDKEDVANSFVFISTEPNYKSIDYKKVNISDFFVKLNDKIIDKNSGLISACKNKNYYLINKNGIEEPMTEQFELGFFLKNGDTFYV